jgi:hypothetical protein
VVRRAFGPFVVVAALAVSLPVAGQQSDPGKLAAAAEEFDEGTKAFKRKDYEEAGAHFEAADRYAPSAGALGNAIRARKAAKQTARTATLCAQALTRFPDDKALADVAKDFLKQNEKSLQRLDISCSPGCTLVLDGKVASAEPVATYAMYVDPGSHSVVAAWSGDRSKTAQVEAKKGATDAQSFEAPPEKKKEAPPPSEPTASAKPVATEAPPPPPPKKPLPPVAVYAGAGATVVLLGVAIWSGLDTKSSPGTDKVRASCSVGAPDCQDLFNQGKGKELRTDLLFGGAALVGVATGVAAYFFTDWSGAPPKPETGRVRVLPAVSHDKSVGISASALFLNEQVCPRPLLSPSHVSDSIVTRSSRSSRRVAWRRCFWRGCRALAASSGWSRSSGCTRTSSATRSSSRCSSTRRASRREFTIRTSSRRSRSARASADTSW